MYWFEETTNYSWKSVVTEDGIGLEICLPGYGKEDLDVRLHNSKRLHVQTKDGKFDKIFKVLVPVDAINSTMVNGILKVDILTNKVDDSVTEIKVN